MINNILNFINENNTIIITSLYLTILIALIWIIRIYIKIVANSKSAPVKYAYHAHGIDVKEELKDWAPERHYHNFDDHDIDYIKERNFYTRDDFDFIGNKYLFVPYDKLLTASNILWNVLVTTKGHMSTPLYYDIYNSGEKKPKIIKNKDWLLHKAHKDRIRKTHHFFTIGNILIQTYSLTSMIVDNATDPEYMSITFYFNNNQTRNIKVSPETFYRDIGTIPEYAIMFLFSETFKIE